MKKTSIVCTFIFSLSLESFAQNELFSQFFSERSTQQMGMEHETFGLKVRSVVPEVPSVLFDTVSQLVRWKPGDAATIGVQLLAGTGATTVAVLSLGFAPWPGLALAALSPVLVFPAAVYFGGNWMGGNGSWLWTQVGFIAGAAFGVPFTSPSLARFFVMITTGCVGSLLGYHLSASPVYESVERASLSGDPSMNRLVVVSIDL